MRGRSILPNRFIDGPSIALTTCLRRGIYGRRDKTWLAETALDDGGDRVISRGPASRRRYLLIPMILFILWGCGIKGPPIPHDASVPEAVLDLEGMVREGKVFLTWAMPSRAVDGSEVGPFKGFEVFREEALLSEEWCEECPEELEPLDVLKMDERDNFSVSGDRVVYQDRRVVYGHLYVYRVKSVTGRGYRSDLSNRAVIHWDAPPEAPGRLEGSAGDRGVILHWDPVEGAEGYGIYRKQKGEEFGHVPIAVVGPKDISHEDGGLSNDLSYHYVVRAVRNIGKTRLEGPSSAEISLIPKDLTSPAPPQGLLAVPLAIGIELSWQRNTEADLLGYFVYRRERAAGKYVRLNVSPVKASVFIDREAILDRSYEYAVTAVDASPQKNESDFSESVTLNYVR
jgi:hypothetical protein